MGQLEDILKHQNMVRNNIMKSFEAETSEDSLEKSFEDEVNPFEMEAYKSELTKAELDEFEKAKHQDGDMHPNGKWVWRASANGGKGDWRVAIPKRSGGAKKTAPAEPAAKTDDDTKKQEAALTPKKKTDVAKKKDTKASADKPSYESKQADAYDKGDGKVGNYPVPTHTSYPAANLYSRLKNNRHFGFKYGLPEEEIMKKLKDYKGNVKVSYHNNAGTSEIYRIKFL